MFANIPMLVRFSQIGGPIGQENGRGCVVMLNYTAWGCAVKANYDTPPHSVLVLLG